MEITSKELMDNNPEIIKAIGMNDRAYLINDLNLSLDLVDSIMNGLSDKIEALVKEYKDLEDEDFSVDDFVEIMMDNEVYELFGSSSLDILNISREEAVNIYDNSENEAVLVFVDDSESKISEVETECNEYVEKISKIIVKDLCQR